MDLAIRVDDNVATLVNVFMVEPADQARLVETLQQAARTLISHQPGYLTAAVHRSFDGRRVVVYSQWRSPDDIAAFRSSRAASEYFSRVADLSQFEPIVCSVTSVHPAHTFG